MFIHDDITRANQWSYFMDKLFASRAADSKNPEKQVNLISSIELKEAAVPDLSPDSEKAKAGSV